MPIGISLRVADGCASDAEGHRVHAPGRLGSPRLGFFVITLKRKDGIKLATIINSDSLELIKQECVALYAYKSETPNQFYVDCRTKNGHVSLHRLVSGAEKGQVIDHINHNSLDNRKANLRVTDTSGNAQNISGAPRDSKSGVRGVSWSKHNGKWKARVVIKRKEHFIGYFETLSEAELAVKEARASLMPFSPEATAGTAKKTIVLRDGVHPGQRIGVGYEAFIGTKLWENGVL